MDTATWINAIPPLALSVGVGVVGFFLRRTIAQVDRHEADLSEIKDRFVTKEEWGGLQDELRAEMCRLSGGIDSLKENTIRKDDFVREIADLNRRQDRIYDILLELKGERTIG
ncbi:hypothetical protein [Ethanoligenens harbinense]|uniref:Uncharacterized protein n=1 Tax=Ethanoligenens harbinense (strain DSM 18485 / JCM 12961 / CGMCC 1.5033 / YUAN-3) TaxID=663278 RepID=E6U8A0_ETHHY|nr:hypothetical protein [Ethanoligenens harbinense]ADU27119.1 hypothetical protein Ethha_1583 [Ethanoligenens harbinense YUAN-3]AVQ96195.1 hypothetical protein CXQ68_08130 [Ethanoligenens harbinense YUAN-3]AYF38855.1 hypothetical protein CXP51_08000 [Ethanoligenens harbinense]AYF41605.1 hypothetical protein CN246_08145 [Ethanoligenens harbinense]QCN92436.1 hypothetical protein DRA42_08160 [Ethanoligenens harbinense]